MHDKRLDIHAGAKNAQQPADEGLDDAICSLSSDDILLDLFLAVKDGDFSNGEWNFDAYDQALKHLMSCGKLKESDL